MPGDEVPTRTRLLEAAVAVMAEHGWAGVTSRVVAERAQANNALVHYYFGSVDALRRAAVMHAVELELEGPVAAILQAGNALDGVVDAVRGMADRGAGTPSQMVMVEALMHGLRDDEMRAEGVTQIRLFRDLLAARLAEQQAAGGLRADADAGGLSIVLSALMDGLLLHVLIDPATDVTGATAGLADLLRPAGDRGDPAGPAGRTDRTDQGDDHDAARP